MRRLLIMAMLLFGTSIFAQHTLPSPPISADNVLQLQSVARLDFDSVIDASTENSESENTILDAEINIGWFVYSPPTDRFLLIDTENTVRAFFGDGTHAYFIAFASLIDAVSFGDEHYAMLFNTVDGYSVVYDNLDATTDSGLRVNVTTDAIPSTLWITCPENFEADDLSCYANVEATSEQLTVIMTMPTFDINSDSVESMNLNDTDLEQRSYTPSNDEDAVVRIGRIQLPYVVTSSLDGIVKLWNLDTSDLVYEVDNGTGEPSVFGNINADATHLVWRDNANETLYLLNFETGENRSIAPLNGEYAQWYFLSNDASVIIAVNLGGEPNVVVWDTITGERADLGNYRDCERPQPDMVRLTEDGSTLIIGCDTGLDIWRVNQGE